MKADLVLFAIGQTGIENYAADMLWNKGFAGVIAHAWLEPFACVGHLLTCIKGGVARRQRNKSLQGQPPNLNVMVVSGQQYGWLRLTDTCREDTLRNPTQFRSPLPVGNEDCDFTLNNFHCR